MGYLFGGNTKLTPAQAKRQREIAEAMLARGGTPQNVGEGIDAIGKAIAGRVHLSRADRAEKAGQSGYGTAFSDYFSSLGGAGVEGSPPAVPSSPAVAGGSSVSPGPQASGPPLDIVSMVNSGATRNRPITDSLRGNLAKAVRMAYGPNHRVEVFSGGQLPKGTPGSEGHNTGSVRHNNGMGADVYVYGPNGKRLRGDALAPLVSYWAANKLGGRGLEMEGGGVHVDEHETPPTPKSGMFWNYGKASPVQQAALTATSFQSPYQQIAAAMTPNALPAGGTMNAPRGQVVPSFHGAVGPRPRPDIGPDLDLSRPIIRDAQGNAQTERSETYQRPDGSWHNRSTVGSPIPTGGPFDTLPAAEDSARLRSNVINQARQPPPMAPQQPQAGAPMDMQAAAAPPPQQVAQAQATQGMQKMGIDPRLMDLMNNPWGNPAQQIMVAKEIGRQIEAFRPRTYEELQQRELLRQQILDAQSPYRHGPPPVQTQLSGAEIAANEDRDRAFNQQSADQLATGRRADDKAANDRLEALNGWQTYVDGELKAGRQPLPFLEFQTQIRKSGANNVTVAGGDVVADRTKGLTASDKDYAPQHNEWTQGGAADSLKLLSQLKQSLGVLESGENVSGPVIGQLPDSINYVVNPQVIENRDQVQEVIQRNLKAILGAQFAKTEGEQLIARAYNTALEEPENVKRIGRLIKQMEIAIEQKNSAAEYWRQHGTLTGWEGKMPTMADFSVFDEGKEKFRYDPVLKKLVPDNG